MMKRMIRSFQDLEVYQESIELAKQIEFMMREFPSYEKYQLVDQMRRASRAVPALIAESWPKRKMVKNFGKYLKDAMGECNEMMAHLELAKRFGHITETKAKKMIEKYDRLGGRLNQLKDNWRNF